jgi:hypothetical protein
MCTSEALRYVDGRHGVEKTLPEDGTEIWTSTIVATARTDVDQDGTDEFIVKATCTWEGGSTNVFALRPDGTGWATMGQVLGDSPGAVGDVAVTSTGEVVVTVGSGPEQSQEMYGLLNPPAVSQQRTYAWTGAAFAQTAGPTTFAADPAAARFTVEVAPVRLGQPSGETRDGTITVTVRAHGPQAVKAALALAMWSERGPGGDWARCGPASDNRAVCDLGVQAAGSAVTLNLPIRVCTCLGLGDGHIATAVVQLDQFEYEPVTIRVANS